jgi:hypothetical protein
VPMAGKLEQYPSSDESQLFTTKLMTPWIDNYYSNSLNNKTHYFTTEYNELNNYRKNILVIVIISISQ